MWCVVAAVIAVHVSIGIDTEEATRLQIKSVLVNHSYASKEPIVLNCDHIASSLKRINASHWPVRAVFSNGYIVLVHEALDAEEILFDAAQELYLQDKPPLRLEG